MNALLSAAICFKNFSGSLVPSVENSLMPTLFPRRSLIAIYVRAASMQMEST